MLDIRIVNGQVIDGSGRPAFKADVGVRDGCIVAIGKVSEPARETVDATGKVVAPGFVDSHTHYDAQVFWDPYLSPSCYHGVTTVLAGNCGFSVAPLNEDAAVYLAPMLARVEGMPLETLHKGVPWDWSSFGSYLDKLEGNLGVNAAFFVGHSAVRRVVMGERAVGHEASAGEIAGMQALVRESLAAGAVGFSTTVSRSHNDADGNPVPSRDATRDELLALATVCRDFEGTTLELLPNLDFDPATVELLVDFSLAGQRPVNWNVLIVNSGDEQEAAEARRKLAVSDYASSRGAVVKALAFVSSPTVRINFWSGFILDGFPDWAPLFRLPQPERLQKLKDREYRGFLDRRARSEDAGMMQRLSDWGTWLVAETFAPANARFKGRVVADIAAECGSSDFDTLIDIVIGDGLKTTLMPPGGGEDRVTYKLRAEVWKSPHVVVGASDAGAHMDMIDAFAFSTRLLEKGVREHGVITLEEAVHQLTEVPAKMMGLRERGNLKEGWHADVVVFDPATVGRGEVYTRYDLPGEQGRLYADAMGVACVIVNGSIIVRDGEHTGAKPGTVLRSGEGHLHAADARGTWPMIELYGCGSPNVLKVLFMLGELELPWRLNRVAVHRGGQLTPELLALNPNGKLPVIVDPDGPGGEPHTVFESGAILYYLAEKTGRLFPQDRAARSRALQWLMWQMASVGPMFGQALHFRFVAPQGNDYARRRYQVEAARLYDVLEHRLAHAAWLAGEEFSIADVAVFPWAGKYVKTLEIDIARRPDVARWIEAIEARSGYQRVRELGSALFREGLEALRQADASDLDRFFGREPAARTD